MNSKERLLGALRGHWIDRVPISTYELVGYNSKSFENNQPSYRHLMNIIREKTDCIAMWNPASNARFQQTAYPLEIEKTQETVGNATIWHTIAHTPGGDLAATSKAIEGQNTLWRTERLCKSPEDVDRVLSVPFVPLQFDASDHERISGEVGENGIIMASLADATCITAELMDFGEYTIWAMTEKEHFSKTLFAVHEIVMENLRRMLEVNVVDLYRICGPEYMTPPYLPPEYFREFVMPTVKEMVDLIHEKGSMVRLHSHGKIGRVMEFIRETNCDGLDPCEGPPDGDIHLSELKRKLGDGICLFGNVQLKLLEHGDRATIRETVKECMDAAKKGGRYVIMPTAAPINIPLQRKTEENYITYIEAALEYGDY